MDIKKITPEEIEKALNYMNMIIKEYGEEQSVMMNMEDEISFNKEYEDFKPAYTYHDNFNMLYRERSTGNKDPETQDVIILYKMFKKYCKIGVRDKEQSDSLSKISNCITKKQLAYGLGERTVDRSPAGGIKRLITLVDQDEGIFNKKQIIPKDLIEKMKGSTKKGYSSEDDDNSVQGMTDDESVSSKRSSRSPGSSF